MGLTLLGFDKKGKEIRFVSLNFLGLGSLSINLSVASIAAANSMPIILSDANKIPDNVMSYIESVKKNVSQTYVLGGTDQEQLFA